jgi:hypothetical protein
MLTLLDYKKAIEFLAYLDYPKDTRSAIKVTKSRALEKRKRKSLRTVFRVAVLGSAPLAVPPVGPCFTRFPFSSHFRSGCCRDLLTKTKKRRSRKLSSV